MSLLSPAMISVRIRKKKEYSRSTEPTMQQKKKREKTDENKKRARNSKSERCASVIMFLKGKEEEIIKRYWLRTSK
jgi:hypothetical protein